MGNSGGNSISCWVARVYGFYLLGNQNLKFKRLTDFFNLVFSKSLAVNRFGIFFQYNNLTNRTIRTSTQLLWLHPPLPSLFHDIDTLPYQIPLFQSSFQAPFEQLISPPHKQPLFSRFYQALVFRF